MDKYVAKFKNDVNKLLKEDANRSVADELEDILYDLYEASSRVDEYIAQYQPGSREYLVLSTVKKLGNSVPNQLLGNWF